MDGIFKNGVRFEEHIDHDGRSAIIMRREDGSIFCAAIPGAALTLQEAWHLVELLNKGFEADEIQRQRDLAVKALQAVRIALDSEELKAWDQSAVLTQLRYAGSDAKGYQGPQFADEVRAALAECEGEDDDG